MPRTRFRFRDDSESWPESLGVSVPIPSPLLIKFPCVHNDSKAIPKLFIYKLESRFRFRFQDYLSWNFGSDSGTTWAEISVPIPRRFRCLTRESQCFGSEMREPGISGTYLSFDTLEYDVCSLVWPQWGLKNNGPSWYWAFFKWYVHIPLACPWQVSLISGRICFAYSSASSLKTLKNHCFTK